MYSSRIKHSAIGRGKPMAWRIAFHVVSADKHFCLAYPARGKRAGGITQDARSPVLASKPKQKSFVAGDVSHRLSILRVNELVAQAEPAAQLLRRPFDWTRPTAAHEWPFDFGEACILAQR